MTLTPICLKFFLKWGASSRWSFGPNSARGSIETTANGMTHTTLDGFQTDAGHGVTSQSETELDAPGNLSDKKNIHLFLNAA